MACEWILGLCIAGFMQTGPNLYKLDVLHKDGDLKTLIYNTELNVVVEEGGYLPFSVLGEETDV